ncbi:Osteoclast stimulatory transmembrane protein [Merluccius polli]|uniref:Osteoclast stimulatory transmembrane protein n=1 Tax=Merluccius polli TaxID=89951 RepID=A0AA47N382_MERPO|nr:Osteoclast stimulatory transmembrane protein [Merluccius polli]
MESIKTSFKYVSLWSGALRSGLAYLWRVYSAPSAVRKDVLVLGALCSGIAVATAGLLYHWLSATLSYGPRGCAAAAGAYGAAVFLLLFLCHPVRCVGTMALLSLCTKRGRKLIVSASFVVLLFNVVPNIALNVGATVRTLRCTSEGFAGSLLNSSALLNAAKADLVDGFGEMMKTDSVMVEKLQKLKNFMHIDTSEVRNRFTNMSAQIETDFRQTNDLVRKYKLLFNRILAALVSVLLIAQSARYLKSYLTSLPFENDHLSAEAVTLLPDSPALRTKHRISRECQSCLLSLAAVTLYFTAMTFVVVLDHIVYRVIDVSVPWLLDIPTTEASLTVALKTSWFVPLSCIVKCETVERVLDWTYSWTLSSDPSLCSVRASPPDPAVRVLLASLWVLSYLVLGLEVLARRARRRVAASFFPQQEERRAAFLVRKVLEKHDQKQQGVFSVSVACV